MNLALTVNCWTDEELMFAQQLGTEMVFAEAIPKDANGSWDVEVLRAMRNRIEKAGLKLAGINQLPLEQTFGCDVGRDTEIEAICRFIDNAGSAGVPLLCYEWALPAVGGLTRLPDGRGGALVATVIPPDSGGASSRSEWDGLIYFLERALPVAEKAGVRLAYRPGDVFTGCTGWLTTLNSIEGVKRLMAATPSPSHGLDFRFTVFAGAPDADVIEAARFFGSKGKLFLITADNLRGSSPITESFIDEGTIDIVSALRACHEAGFKGTLRPGRQPVMTDDTEWGHKAQALAVGYLRALLQGLNALPVHVSHGKT